MGQFYHVDDLKHAVTLARATVSNPDGWVYLVHWRDPERAAWKIGMSRQLDRRIEQLHREYGQHLHLRLTFKIDCLGDPQYLERVLHIIYAPLACTIKGHREWFYLEQTDIAWLRGMGGINCSQLRENIGRVTRRTM